MAKTDTSSSSRSRPGSISLRMGWLDELKLITILLRSTPVYNIVNNITNSVTNNDYNIIISVSQETSNKSLVRQIGSPMYPTRLAQTTVTAPGSVRETHSISRKKSYIHTQHVVYSYILYTWDKKCAGVSSHLSMGGICDDSEAVITGIIIERLEVNDNRKIAYNVL